MADTAADAHHLRLEDVYNIGQPFGKVENVPFINTISEICEKAAEMLR